MFEGVATGGCEDAAGAAGSVGAGACSKGAEAGAGAVGNDGTAPVDVGAAGAVGTCVIKLLDSAAVGLWLRVACQAITMLMAKNVMASHLVDLVRKFDEPREPNTVPDAPPPNPEPACAPAPRCMRISAIIAMAIRT